MPSTYSKTFRPQPVDAAGKSAMQSVQDDIGAFSLRDTLRGISVREANFGEFLAAMKQRGMLMTQA